MCRSGATALICSSNRDERRATRVLVGEDGNHAGDGLQHRLVYLVAVWRSDSRRRGGIGRYVDDGVGVAAAECEGLVLTPVL